MRATFGINGDRHSTPGGDDRYDVCICFNGEPGKVVLEVERTRYTPNGLSEPQSSATEHVMRAVMTASEGRAIASALLSAATEAKQ